MTTLVLSLCVPTYNRASLLDGALRAILGQIGQAEAAQVEVVVLDNASPDDTPDVVERARADYPEAPVRYVRHSGNIGSDANFYEAVKQAQGRFVYLLSDDDILLPGAVPKLLALIAHNPDFDGFCLNVRPFVDRLENSLPPLIDLPHDVVLHDRNDVLGLLGPTIGFISIVAFNRSRVADSDYSSRVGTNFVHAFLFLDALASGNGFVALAEPLLAQRSENATNLNYFRVFVTSLHTVLTYAEEVGYSRKVTRRIEAKNLIAVRHFVSSVKLHGKYAELWSSYPDAIGRLFQVYRFHPYLWLVVVPLMFFPRVLRPLVPVLRGLLRRPKISAGAGEANASRVSG